MTLKPRILARTILKAVRTFPAVVVSGPRQSGKTTLVNTLFARTHRSVNLENPDVRLRAKDDPSAFLADHPPPVLIDEIQYAPELLSYIKSRIDEDRRPGQWVLTGSQRFALMDKVSQSLAGRAAVLSLLPFGYAERIGRGAQARDVGQWLRDPSQAKEADKPPPLSEVLLRGHYPEIASRQRVDRHLWCGSYLTTYLERDIRNLANVGDLSQFERFLKLCAMRTAQILNLSDMARDIGVSVPTARRWLSLLETGYQVFLLPPYYRNLGKRLVKSPKLYFTDTALASYLLGLHDKAALLNGPSFGSLFETLVVVDVWKRFLHFGQMPALYYLRSRDGLEVDLVIEWAGRLHLFEIKSAATITPQHAVSLKRLAEHLGSQAKSAAILSCSPTTFRLTGRIMNYRWSQALAE